MFYLLITIIIGALAITFWAHYFIFHALAAFFNITGRLYLNLLRAAFIILPLSFIAASILIARVNNLLTRLYYSVAAIWLGAVLYLLLACLAVYSLLFLGKFLGWNFNPAVLAAIFFSAAAAIVVYGALAARQVEVKNLTLKLPNLPAEWRGKTAVWISDLHLGALHGQELALKAAEQINGLKPDLLLVGGDLFDGQKNVDLGQLAAPFARIQAPAGKFFITGNHEEFDGADQFIKAVTAAGLKYLNNQLIDLNGLQLIGLDYRTAYDRAGFAGILKNLNIKADRPSVLLRHVPDKIDVARDAGISLVICGHTHRGQLWPVEIVPYLLYDGFAYGLKKAGATLVYTSSGAGTWGPPLRIFAAPEIVRITFE